MFWLDAICLKQSPNLKNFKMEIPVCKEREKERERERGGSKDGGQKMTAYSIEVNRVRKYRSEMRREHTKW